jgi:hypothetical protein
MFAILDKAKPGTESTRGYQAKKYTLGTDPKENTTSERTPKKIPPHCCREQKENAPAANKKQT